jgi:hypothetical protein
MDHTRTILAAAILIGLAAGCSLPATPSPGPSQVWILQPADGASLPLGPVPIKFQGASFTGIEAFEVSFNGIPLGDITPLSSGSGGPDYGTMFYGEATWEPVMGGDYTLQVRARNAAGQYSPSAEVQVTVTGGPVANETPAAMKPVPSPTPTYSQWGITAILDANCRFGPSPDYESTSFVLAGQMAEAIGRNADGSWLLLHDPRGGPDCWAAIGSFEPEFDVGDLPVQQAPPKPTPSQPGSSSQTGCLIKDPASGQDRCYAPCPARAAGPACKP